MRNRAVCTHQNFLRDDRSKQYVRNTAYPEHHSTSRDSEKGKATSSEWHTYNKAKATTTRKPQ